MSLRINTLGGLSVSRDGRPLGGAAAQPRRLAVLAMLARAGERGVTREKLLATLWPDAEEEQGRKHLAQALYMLRRDLGDEEAIAGTKELRLDPTRVAIDAAEYAAAVREGALERAAAAYAGPFLDGFHLPAAPEFERWAEREREVLEHDYRGLLERLATAATERGDHAAAVGWWKRLAAQDPLSARTATRLMRALAAAGDVAGALRHAQIYQALVEQELEVAADREVLALAAELRAATVRAPAPAPAPPTAALPAPPPTAPAVAPAPEAAEVAAPAAVALEPPSAPVSTAAVGPAAPSAAPPAAPPLPPAAPRSEASDPASHPAPARRRVAWHRVAAALVAGLAIGGASVAAYLSRAAPREAAALDAAAGTPSVVDQGAAPGSRRPVVAIARIADHRARTPAGFDLGLPLADMLATNLARSPELRVLSAARLHEVAQQLGGRDTLAAMTGAARHVGATELVDGALFGLADGGLRLDLRRVDLATGDVLAAHTVTGRDPFALVDSGTARLVSGYGARAPTGSIADVTTRSLTAYRLYEEGLRAYFRQDVPAAARLFEAARGEDSTFAMATLYAALAASMEPRRSLPLLSRAVRLAEQASDRERLIIRAEFASLSSSPALGAIAETLSTRYPDEVDGHLYRGMGLERAGRYLEAVAPLERAIAMDSLSVMRGSPKCSACRALQLLGWVYELTDSMPARERLARRWTRLQPDAAAAWLSLAAAMQMRGQIAQADSAWRRAASLDAKAIDPAWPTMLRLHAYDLDGAERAARALLASGVPAERQSGRWVLTIVLRQQGRMREAYDVARAYRAEASQDAGMDRTALPAAAVLEGIALLDLGRAREAAEVFERVSRYAFPDQDEAARARTRTWHLAHAANAYAAAGDTAALRRLVDSTRVYGARSNFVRDQRLHHHVHGLLLAARGRHADAVAEFERARFSRSVMYARTTLAHARALLETGRPPEAIALLQTVMRSPLDGLGLYATRTEAHELLAEAWSKAGRADSATAHWQTVARAWSNGDPPYRTRAATAERAAGSAAGRR